jgi:hypothetical protein
MTGRELVRRAVTFGGPERIPRELPDPYGSDFTHVGIPPDPGWKPSEEGEDEWRCVWKKVSVDDRTMGQVKVHPLEDYSSLDDFPFPDFDIPERYEHIPAEIEKNVEEKFLMAGIPLSLIHRLHYLRGHKNAMLDPYMHPEELRIVLDQMTEIALDSLKRLAPFGIDGVISCDDWGLQDRALMPPKVFEEFFKPCYKRIYHRAHEYGMLTFLHSCGHITELLDDFIEAELDTIQMDQQQNMGVENLAEGYGGRISFWCPVDIQNTMVRGSMGDVRRYARRLIECFGPFDGGFISKWYPSPDAISHSRDKIQTMSETFVKYGRYA